MSPNASSVVCPVTVLVPATGTEGVTVVSLVSTLVSALFADQLAVQVEHRDSAQVTQVDLLFGPGRHPTFSVL